jgi:RecJ-like exonuclease
MSVKINISMPKNICPSCFGTGKVKVMQLATGYGGATIRTKDGQTKCSNCKGTGLVKE